MSSRRRSGRGGSPRRRRRGVRAVTSRNRWRLPAGATGSHAGGLAQRFGGPYISAGADIQNARRVLLLVWFMPLKQSSVPFLVPALAVLAAEPSNPPRLRWSWVFLWGLLVVCLDPLADDRSPCFLPQGFRHSEKGSRANLASKGTTGAIGVTTISDVDDQALQQPDGFTLRGGAQAASMSS